MSRRVLFLFVLALASTADAQVVFVHAPTEPTSCPVECTGTPGRDGVDGRDGRDGIDGRDGVVPRPQPSTLTTMHYDTILRHPLAKACAGDIFATATSQFGQFKRLVWYFQCSKTVVILDPNLPESANLIAFTRAPGPSVAYWKDMADYGPGVLAYNGVTPDGFNKLCLIADGRLFTILNGEHVPIQYFAAASLPHTGALPELLDEPQQ